MPSSAQALTTLLKNHFGYDQFRLHQQVIIERTLDGLSSLVIMPTGGGKSLCYQLPALQLPGITLVISPLIALMQDQVDALTANGIASAALNSSCSKEQEQAICQQVEAGELRLLYVSPERAVQDYFIRWLRSVELSQIAIDEAHCVSVWGNDFRPEYRRLTQLTQHFADVPQVALTATADSATQQDIIAQLQLPNAELFLSSFERANITPSVLPAQKRMPAIVKFVKERKGRAGIIYCLSRKSTEEVAIKLQQQGYRAVFYHARLSADERKKIAQQFQRDEIDIICATIAFGMGIDKPNVRWVIHYNMPKNIESYYQEIGRAGRDGEPAEALLFAGFGDKKVLTDFIDNSQSTDEYKEIQKSKLERMWTFSQSASCRTNVVLNYFGEFREKTCGHCDRCLYPPKTFDGTIIAQKAISACVRLQQERQERVNMFVLVDILRGSRKAEIIEQNFDTIKTYGAGKEYDWQTWLHYITQLVDQGLLMIDFSDGNKLVPTELAKPVLKSEKTVQLIELQALEQLNKNTQLNDTQSPYDSGLFEQLRSLRLDLADARSIPPFAVFADASLKEMARDLPLSRAQFATIKGVGRHKLDEFGEAFLTVIGQYLDKPIDLSEVVVEPVKRSSSKPSAHHLTADAVSRGLSLKEVASDRGIKKETVVSHLLKAYQEGVDIDFERLVPENEKELVDDAWHACEKTSRLKPIYDALEGALDYDAIRLALIVVQRQSHS